jgi:hypothetical protein
LCFSTFCFILVIPSIEVAISLGICCACVCFQQLSTFEILVQRFVLKLQWYLINNIDFELFCIRWIWGFYGGGIGLCCSKGLKLKHGGLKKKGNKLVDYRNPSFGLITRAKGLQGCGPKGSPWVKVKRLQGCGRRKSPGVTLHIPGNVKKCEGVWGNEPSHSQGNSHFGRWNPDVTHSQLFEGLKCESK